MNKYLVIDTETSGLFDFSKPADAEGQPRMASMAMIYLDEDLDVVDESMHYIKPVGWEMSEAVTKINGLTTDFLLKAGEPIESVLYEYVDAIDQGLILVAFNAQFDSKVLRGELRRAGIPDRFETTPNICTMRAATNICKIPKKTGYGFKFPKLAEACKFFNIKQEAEHTALDDARACVGVLKNLVALGLCPEPEVHHAKGV